MGQPFLMPCHHLQHIPPNEKARWKSFSFVELRIITVCVNSSCIPKLRKLFSDRVYWSNPIFFRKQGWIKTKTSTHNFNSGTPFTSAPVPVQVHTLDGWHTTEAWQPANSKTCSAGWAQAKGIFPSKDGSCFLILLCTGVSHACCIFISYYWGRPTVPLVSAP